MRLIDKIKLSYSLGRKKYHYNNDTCFLLDGMNSRKIKMRDINPGDIIKPAPRTPAVKITSKPVLEPHKFGGYRWNYNYDKVERVTDSEEE